MNQITGSFQSETDNTVSLDMIKAQLERDQAPGESPL